MILSYDQDSSLFLVKTKYDDREVVKGAGFRWNATLRHWYSADPDVAFKLSQYADDSCQRYIEQILKDREQTRELSRASYAHIDVQAPIGKAYHPFQCAGIEFIGLKPGVLLADEPGLGKTIEAIGAVNGDLSLRRILVICPNTIKINWAREILAWCLRTSSIIIYQNNGQEEFGVSVIPFPGSVPPKGTILWSIIHYDVIHKHPDIMSTSWDLLILDEAHYCKNPKARRTMVILGGYDKKTAHQFYPIPARRKFFLSGTPFKNRPIELWPLLSTLDPQTWDNFWRYVKQYCGAQKSKYGWDLSGASNLDELQETLRSTIMLRRLKKDVLKELPPKVRQIIEIPPNGAHKTIEREQKAWKQQQEKLTVLRGQVHLAKLDEHEEIYTLAVKNLQSGVMKVFAEISNLRKATALAKVPAVLEMVEPLLEDRNYYLVIFAHHHDVINQITKGLEKLGYCPCVLTGQTSLRNRQVVIDHFQAGDSQIFIGSLTAAGVGITLTRSSHVLFAELDWVPGTVTQAEDRCHRIGQENSVLIQHCVIDGSIDARIVKRLVEKQTIIDQALDIKTDLADLPILPEFSDRDSISSRWSVKELREELSSDLQYTREAFNGKILVALNALKDSFQKALESPLEPPREVSKVHPIDSYVIDRLACCSPLTPIQAVLGLKLVQGYYLHIPARLLP